MTLPTFQPTDQPRPNEGTQGSYTSKKKNERRKIKHINVPDNVIVVEDEEVVVGRVKPALHLLPAVDQGSENNN